MKTILLFLLFSNIPFLSADAQSDEDCKKIRNRADSAIKAENLDEALNRLRAFKACNMKFSKEADDKIIYVFNLIKKQKERAELAEQEAKKQAAIAQQKTKEVIQQSLIAQLNNLSRIATLLNDQNHETAIRIAEFCYNILPNRQIAQVFSSLISDTTYGYRKKLRTLNSGFAFVYNEKMNKIVALTSSRVIVYDTSWKEFLAFEIPMNFQKFSQVQFSPDGSVIACLDTTGKIVLLHPYANKFSVINAKPVTSSISLSRDKKTLASLRDGQFITLYDAEGQEMLSYDLPGKEPFNFIRISPNNKLLALAKEKEVVIILDTFGHREKFYESLNEIKGVAFLDDNQLLFSDSNTIYKMDALSMQEPIRLFSAGEIFAWQPSNTGKYIVCAYTKEPLSNDVKIVLLDSNGNVVKRFSNEKRMHLTEKFSFSEDDTKLFNIEPFMGYTQWQIDNRAERIKFHYTLSPRTLYARSMTDHGENVLYSSEDSALITNKENEIIKIIDLNNNPGHVDRISADKSKLLQVYGSTLSITDTLGKKIFACPIENIFSLYDVLPDFTQLAIKDENSSYIHTYDLKVKKHDSIFLKYVTSLAFSTKGKLLVITNSNKLNLVDLNTKKISSWERSQKFMDEVHTSPSGNYIVVCNQDQTADIFDKFLNPLMTFYNIPRSCDLVYFSATEDKVTFFSIDELDVRYTPSTLLASSIEPLDLTTKLEYGLPGAINSIIANKSYWEHRIAISLLIHLYRKQEQEVFLTNAFQFIRNMDQALVSSRTNTNELINYSNEVRQELANELAFIEEGYMDKDISNRIINAYKSLLKELEKVIREKAKRETQIGAKLNKHRSTI